jgi:hypothetical protein
MEVFRPVGGRQSRAFLAADAGFTQGGGNIPGNCKISIAWRNFLRLVCPLKSLFP